MDVIEDEPTTVEQRLALERIDSALETCKGRTLVPVAEYTDVLLDLRLIIATSPPTKDTA